MISAVTLSPLLTTQEAFLDSVRRPIVGYWKVVRGNPAMRVSGVSPRNLWIYRCLGAFLVRFRCVRSDCTERRVVWCLIYTVNISILDYSWNVSAIGLYFSQWKIHFFFCSERVNPYPAVSDHAFIILRCSNINFCQINPPTKWILFYPLKDRSKIFNSI